ncbi:MAG: metalloregulator ArsR/SmtB family transcription factor [Anaerolineae bacterium]|nr:metalloregulator ArsR/SmtB family transcription factor [Anaerolineae bacterium]
MDNQSRQELKALLYEQFARMGKAFANARRLEIIDLLSQTPHTVEELASKTSLSVASVSQHLQVLRNARVVDVTREGTYAWYRLSDDRVFGIWCMMRDLAQDRISEIDHLLRQYFNERETLETIDAAELLRRIAEGSIIIIDARPEDEYRAGHIPSALSVPIEKLESTLAVLPKNCEIVAYCRASYCLLSDEVALLLREQGYRVHVLLEGFPEWRAAGLPIEKESLN